MTKYYILKETTLSIYKVINVERNHKFYQKKMAIEPSFIISIIFVRTLKNKEASAISLIENGGRGERNATLPSRSLSV